MIYNYVIVTLNLNAIENICQMCDNTSSDRGAEVFDQTQPADVPYNRITTLSLLDLYICLHSYVDSSRILQPAYSCK